MVGYAITLDEEIAGTNGSTVSSFSREGGLSKMGVSTAYLFGKGLSVGTNLSYVTGTITQTETQGNATEETSSYKHTFMPILVFSTNGQSTANVSSLPEPYTDTHRTSGKRTTSTSAAVQEEKILKAA